MRKVEHGKTLKKVVHNCLDIKRVNIPSIKPLNSIENTKKLMLLCLKDDLELANYKNARDLIETYISRYNDRGSIDNLVQQYPLDNCAKERLFSKQTDSRIQY